MTDKKTSKIVGEFDNKADYDKKYFAEKYSQVKLSMPNAEAEALTNFLNKHGIKSKAGFIREAIKEKMEHMEQAND